MYCQKGRRDGGRGVTRLVCVQETLDGTKALADKHGFESKVCALWALGKMDYFVSFGAPPPRQKLGLGLGSFVTPCLTGTHASSSAACALQCGRQ